MVNWSCGVDVQHNEHFDLMTLNYDHSRLSCKFCSGCCLATNSQPFHSDKIGECDGVDVQHNKI